MFHFIYIATVMIMLSGEINCNNSPGVPLLYNNCTAKTSHHILPHCKPV